MSSEQNRGEINISKIPVEGVGGLGLLAMAGVTAWAVQPLRLVGLIVVCGGITIGLLLIAAHRVHR